MTNDLTIGLILPDVLGTYGDDGNALVLRQRARMRGLTAEIQRITLTDPVPEGCDVYTMGGGEDTAQILASEKLREDKGLIRAVEAGRPLLAICAGLQVLSSSFRANGREVAGVGLIDATTSPMSNRAIGEVASAPLLDGLTQPITGFENHLGGTILGPQASPLGRVTRGNGNINAESARKVSADADTQVTYEGAVQGSIIATYMHGPVLARNPELADLLLARAVGVNELEPLELPVIEKLRAERLR